MTLSCEQVHDIKLKTTYWLKAVTTKSERLKVVISLPKGTVVIQKESNSSTKLG